METYVMSDIHGELELFKRMLKEIKFSEEDKLIILGDAIDRGPNPIGVIDYVMESKNIELLMGNHEKMFLDFLLARNEGDKYSAYHLFVGNGGYSTLKEFDTLSEKRRKKITDYILSLPLYKIRDNYIMVHSGLNMSGLENVKDINEIMGRQSEEDILWSRKEFYMNKGVEGYTIVFGHTPTISIRGGKGNFSIWYDTIHKDKIGIDCGATFANAGGKLACLRLNDMKEYYVWWNR